MLKLSQKRGRDWNEDLHSVNSRQDFTIPSLAERIHLDPLALSFSKKVKRTNESVEKMFTALEVEEIVARKMEELESRLRETYERLINEKLHEQWLNFSKYVEDQVSNNWKRREEPSYIA